MFLFSHLTFLMQLLYLGKLRIPKYHEFSLKLLIFPIDIKCKIVTTLSRRGGKIKHVSMCYDLSNKCQKFLLTVSKVQVIVEDVVTCFIGT